MSDFSSLSSDTRKNDRLDINENSQNTVVCSSYLEQMDLSFFDIPIDTWNSLKYVDHVLIVQISTNIRQLILHLLQNSNTISKAIQVIHFTAELLFYHPIIYDQISDEAFLSQIFNFFDEFEDIALYYELINLIGVLCKNDSICNWFISNNIISKLMSLLNKSELIEIILNALIIIVKSERFECFVIFDQISNLIHSEYHVQALKILSNLIHEEIADKYYNIIEIVYHILDSVDQNAILEALNLLNEISKEPKTFAHIISSDDSTKNNFYNILINFTMNNPQFAENALKCISNSCMLSSSYVTKAIENSLLDLLNFLLENGSIMVQYIICYCVSVLISYSDFIDLQTIIESEIISKILENYDDFGDVTLLVILDGFNRCLLNEEESAGTQFREYLYNTANEFLNYCAFNYERNEEKISIISRKILEKIEPD